jgi:hypothetical protein
MRRVLVLGSTSAIFILASCRGVAPSATISDPAVFTSAHIAAVPSALAASQHDLKASGNRLEDPTMGAVRFRTVTDELMRTFRQESTGSDEPDADDTDDTADTADTKAAKHGAPRRLVMDEELDRTQRIRTLAQFLAERFALKASVQGPSVGGGGSESAPKAPSEAAVKDETAGTPAEEGEAGEPGEPSAPGSGGGSGGGSAGAGTETPKNTGGANVPQPTPGIDAETIKAFEELFTASVQDSPFDRLDRAVDYYTAFLLKVLPGIGGDTRLLDGERLKGRVRIAPFEAEPPTKESILAAANEVSIANALVGRSEQEIATTRSDIERLDRERFELMSQWSTQLAAVAGDEAGPAADKAEAAVAVQERVRAVDTELTVRRARLVEAEGELAAHKRTIEVAEGKLDALFVPIGSGSSETPSRIKETDARALGRLILLTFQTHVHPGSEPNTMTGVRIRVVGVHRNGGTVDRDEQLTADDVRVIRLHPTRSYDVESQAFLEIANRIAEIALSGGAAVGGASASGSVDASRREEVRERRQFLSRITKTASWADAANHEFGWNFYPTNLSSAQRSLLSRLGDVVTLQSRSSVEVQAFLEGGARDCAAWLIVPTDVRSIELEVSHVVASLDPLAMDRKENRYFWTADHRLVQTNDADELAEHKRISVTLPPWHISEAEAFFFDMPQTSTTSSSPSPQP